MNNFSDFGIESEVKKRFIGDKIKVERILNKQVIVLDYKIEPSKYQGECLYMQFQIGDTKRISFTSGKTLIEKIQKVKPEQFPFKTIIVQLEDDSFDFT